MQDTSQAIGIVEMSLTTPGIRQALDRYQPLLKTLAERIGRDGSLFIFADNAVRDGQLIPWPEILGEHLGNFQFKLKNLFIWFHEARLMSGKRLASAHTSVLFMVKSLKDYYFDKDSIREPHIFKDIEWGKREVGVSGYHKERESLRYPEKGRDPGNLFHEARRDEKGQVLSYIPYPKGRLLEKLVKVSSQTGWTILTNVASPEMEDVSEKTGRLIHEVEAGV